MDAKINIAKILKDKPQGTKLWTDMFGSVTLYVVTDACDAFQVKHHNKEPWFDKNGKLCKEGVLCIYPSKSMRNWEKFAWEKGDVLVSNEGGTEVIFDKWYDNTYTNFYCKHYLNSEDENNIKYNEAFLCTTERYSLEDKDSAQTYINTIEERLSGKLNRKTLEIEKNQPKFKDGDIVVYKCEIDDVPSTIFIFRGINQRTPYYSYYASLDSDGFLSYKLGEFGIYNRELRLATEEEKQQLFSALAKEGKAWDSDKKQIVDLKPKVGLKPFDKVLCRDDNDTPWKVGLFSHIDGKMFQCVGSIYRQCIPYEGNEHLLGTTKNVEG